MKLKGYIEKYKNWNRKMTAVNDGFEVFLETELNLKELMHVNWWFQTKRQFAKNNVIETILSTVLKNNDKWHMEALCAYIGQIYSELSEEEKLDLEEGEYFSQVFEKYNSYFDLDLEDVDARLQANYGITYLEARENIFFKFEKANWFERLIYATYTSYVLTLFTVFAATILTVLVNIFSLYDAILTPQNLIFSDIELNFILETILRLIVVLLTAIIILIGIGLGALIVLVMTPLFELYGTPISSTTEGISVETFSRYLTEILWLVSYLSPIFWIALIYIIVASMQSGMRAFKIAKIFY